MALFFLIVFIGAIVGVFRPYKFIPQGKRWHYGLLAFASFMGVGIAAPEPVESTGGPSAANSGDETTADGAEQSENSPDTKPEPNWVYDTQIDQMRAEETKFATVKSENTITFDFPYGECSPSAPMAQI